MVNDVMTLTELTLYMAYAGVPRSRKELQRRCLAGTIGHKIGHQWVVTRREADALAETLRRKG
ncbi:MAG: hypothetical protein MUQ56_08760 [Thermoleophilia bacterium]|nr:hypothetical protein [Thermoleophilia bacterium]